MSRLSSISIENFKSFGARQTIPLKPLTLIFGENSAGKSSIFHALDFLRWCDQTNGNCNPDRVERDWDSVSLGGIANLVHQHDLSKKIKIGLGFEKDPQEQDGRGNFSGQFNVEWTFEAQDHSYVASSCKIDKDGREVGAFKNSDREPLRWRGEVAGVSFENLSKSSWALFVGEQWPPGHDGLWWDPIPENERLDLDAKFRAEFLKHIESGGLSFDGLYPGFGNLIENYNINGFRYQYRCVEIRERMNAGLVSGNLSDVARFEFFDLALHLETLKSGFFPKQLGSDRFSQITNHLHVGPLRQPPFREMYQSALKSSKKWEPWAQLITYPETREEVSRALAVLGVPYQLVTRLHQTLKSFPNSDAKPELSQAEYILEFRKLSDGVTSSHLDLGFGVSAILPVVVALYGRCNYPIISIEQPELHIHPKLQANLGDLFIERALGEGEWGYRQPQRTIIAETHSENLILRVLRRIRETTEGRIGEWPEALRRSCPGGVRPEDVAVLYVEPHKEGANVIELPVTEDGGFSRPWPDGFFADRINEVYSLPE